jgi:hypothetical protein
MGQVITLSTAQSVMLVLRVPTVALQWNLRFCNFKYLRQYVKKFSTYLRIYNRNHQHVHRRRSNAMSSA